MFSVCAFYFLGGDDKDRSPEKEIGSLEQFDQALLDEKVIDMPNVFGCFTVNKFFKRNFYEKMADQILDFIETQTLVVLGNPGIGKSSFCDYCFLYFVFKKKKAVCKVMEDGNWIYADGSTNTFLSGVKKTMGRHWTRDDVYLLLDGSVDAKFMPKQKYAVVFASSRKRNYHKFIKNTGYFTVMNPWSLEEVKEYAKELYKQLTVEIKVYRNLIGLPIDILISLIF